MGNAQEMRILQTVPGTAGQLAGEEPALEAVEELILLLHALQNAMVSSAEAMDAVVHAEPAILDINAILLIPAL